MGLITMLIVVIVVLAIVGLGWKSFSTGVLSGFERVLNVGDPLIKNITQQARELVNYPNLMLSG
jgi:Tfp pilus assembly protein PilO